MEFDDLKSNWKKTGYKAKSESELQLMTKVKKHPKLKRIRIKLVIETILLIAFVAVYKDIFDGGDKPLWVNICLIASAVLYVLNDMLGYFILQNPIKGRNIAQSIKRLRFILKRLLAFSIVTSLFFGVSVIMFFTSTIRFTLSKYLMLAGVIITFLVFIYFSYKNWQNRVAHIRKAAEEFNEAV